MRRAKTRSISEGFQKALKCGALSPILAEIREPKARGYKELDETLCLDIRHQEITLYYRGAALVSLCQKAPGTFVTRSHDKYQRFLPNGLLGSVQSIADCKALVEQIPLLKAGIDAKLARTPSREREIQQEIIRCNNRGKSGRSSDIYFCDQEYAVGRMRADLVGVLWPSDGARRRHSNHRLVWAELKQGDGAMGGKAGLQKHLNDLDALLGDPQKLTHIKDEMGEIFRVKQELGLINCGKAPRKGQALFSSAKPLVLLILVDHDPAKTKLGKELQGASMQHGDVVIPRASTMGYSLFANELLSVSELLDLDKAWRG